MTGTADLIAGSKQLQEMGPPLVIVTMGREGAFIRYDDFVQSVETFTVKTIDTTGAGGAFWGAFYGS